MNVSENNPVPVVETEPAENTEKVNAIGSVEISITTLSEEADEATKLEYSASDTKKFTFEKLLLLPKVKLPKISRLTLIQG